MMLWVKRKLLSCLKIPYKLSEENIFSKDKTLTQITYYRVGNAGDTVLSQCLRRTFRELIGLKRWKLYSVSEKVTSKMIKSINKTSALIIGGGGLFLPDTNANSVSGWQWAIPKEEIQNVSIPIIVYAVGYNYFHGQECNVLFEKNLNILLRKCSFIGLRNHGSIDKVNEILDKYDNKSACVSVRYQPCTTTLIRKIYKGIPPKIRTGVIGINMAFDRENMRYGSQKEKILQEVAKAIKKISNRGYQICYIAHCLGDLQFETVLRREGIRFKTIDLNGCYPDYIYKIYNGIDCMIGMRGHAQMIPFGLNCEIISLGTHDKMRWFLEDIEATDWYIDLNQDPSNICECLYSTFLEIHENNSANTMRRLLMQQEKLWNITIENAKIINECINN